MAKTPSRFRPRPTKEIILWALADCAGMFLFASGLIYFRDGNALGDLLHHSPLSAAITSTCGLLLMVYSCARILREVLNQLPEQSEQ